eukprot:gene6696-6766_t
MKYLILAALLLLAACGSQPGSPEACAYVEEGHLPIRLANGLPITVIKLNGKDARMILDTGASTTVAFGNAFQRLGLARDSTLHGFVTVVGSGEGVVVGQVGNVNLGGATRSDVQIIVINSPFFEKYGIDGLLGADLLGEFDLEVDYNAPSATLFRKRRCPQGGPNWAGPYEQLPRPPQGQALPANVIEVMLDGTRQNAMIDTGANNITLDRLKALESGATAESFAADTKSQTQGATQNATATVSHVFKALSMGSETIANPAITVSAKPEQIGTEYVRMLIGYAYLAKRKLWISYGDRRLFVSRPQ